MSLKVRPINTLTFSYVYLNQFHYLPRHTQLVRKLLVGEAGHVQFSCLFFFAIEFFARAPLLQHGLKLDQRTLSSFWTPFSNGV
ncbi:hypothetical protein Lal_00047979 [Lupinus albus]|nr:hypothetical protein Lal_00047979 [Lupinus albus]